MHSPIVIAALAANGFLVVADAIQQHAKAAHKAGYFRIGGVESITTRFTAVTPQLAYYSFLLQLLFLQSCKPNQ
jgi:hypothetical protein